MLKKTLESPLGYKEIQPVHPKGNQSWIFIRRTDAETKAQYFGHLMWKANTLEKTQCWERLRAGGERDHRGWDGWIASLTRWTWVWTSSGRWWRIGRPNVLQSMGLQRVGHDWAKQQQQPQPAYFPAVTQHWKYALGTNWNLSRRKWFAVVFLCVVSDIPIQCIINLGVLLPELLVKRSKNSVSFNKKLNLLAPRIDCTKMRISSWKPALFSAWI